VRAVVFQKKIAFRVQHPEPQPAAGDCLVQVHLAGICGTDLEIVRGYQEFHGVLGHEFVGTVLRGSKSWEGKRVACEINAVCRKCELCLGGLALHCRNRTVMGIKGRDGCFADLVAVPEANLHEVPERLSDEEAVFIEPLAAAFQVIAQCPIEERMSVSVIGPGRLGLLVAQVLATTGCKLTVVGRSGKGMDLCEKAGIQAIHVRDLALERNRDVVVDCTGSPAGLALAMEIIRPRGTIVLKSTYSEAGPLNLAPLVIHEVRVLGSRCGPFGEAINALARGAINVRPLISRTYPIEKALEAFEAAADPENLKVLLKIKPK